MQEQIVYKGTDWERFLQQVLSEAHCTKPMLVCGKHVLKRQDVLDYISNYIHYFVELNQKIIFGLFECAFF